MPRKLRLEYPGAIYHIMSRGDQRQDIFLNDVDRHDFIKTLAEACQKTDWEVDAFCLMRENPPSKVVWTGNSWSSFALKRIQATLNRNICLDAPIILAASV